MTFKDCTNTMDALKKAIDDTKEYVDDTLVSYPTITEMDDAIQTVIESIPHDPHWVRLNNLQEFEYKDNKNNAIYSILLFFRKKTSLDSFITCIPKGTKTNNAIKLPMCYVTFANSQPYYVRMEFVPNSSNCNPKITAENVINTALLNNITEITFNYNAGSTAQISIQIYNNDTFHLSSDA